MSITGGLTFGAGSVLDIQGTLDGADTYVIATYNAGTLVDTFADALDATTQGYNVIYGNTQIILDELDGDANRDGVVNIFDLNLVSLNWDPTGPVGRIRPRQLESRLRREHLRRQPGLHQLEPRGHQRRRGARSARAGAVDSGDRAAGAAGSCGVSPPTFRPLGKTDRCRFAGFPPARE